MKPTEPKGRLTREWRGHTITVDKQGLAIDGQTIDATPLTERDACPQHENPRSHPSLQFLPDGDLVYRGHVVAEVQPDKVTVHGNNGNAWPQRDAQPEPGEKAVKQAEQVQRLLSDRAAQLADDSANGQPAQAVEPGHTHNVEVGR